MSVTLENSLVVMDLVKFSFHSDPKEIQRQRTFKLLYR